MAIIEPKLRKIKLAGMWALSCLPMADLPLGFPDLVHSQGSERLNLED